MWERVRVFRTYQTKVILGLLQTAAYMTAILTSVRAERGIQVDDVAEAVAERIGRQGYLLQRGRQFLFVVEEPVLWFRPYGAQVQREQLTHLLGRDEAAFRVPGHLSMRACPAATGPASPSTSPNPPPGQH